LLFVHLAAVGAAAAPHHKSVIAGAV